MYKKNSLLRYRVESNCLLVLALSLASAAPLLVAQDESHDRQKIWIRAVTNEAVPDRAKSKTGSTPQKAESLPDEAWISRLQQQLASTSPPWTELDAATVYQQLCRALLTGNRSVPEAQWVKASVLFPLKFNVQARSVQRHPVVGWAAGSYAVTTSKHFTVATQGSTRQAVEVAGLCEQTYAVWRQLFFSTWSKADTFQRSLASRQPLPEPDRSRFQIVIFRNRDGYLKQLEQLEPNVAVSTGYYSPRLKTVFCYWDEATSLATLRHELTHQFFSQAARQEVVAPEDLPSDFWIVEGLALYMESIQILSGEGYDVATIGGWDAARLQPARYRRLHDETWIPWDEFRRANNERFRTGSDIKEWYSQAAGLVHFWLDGEPRSRQAFLDYVDSVYRGSPDPTLLIEPNQDEALRQAYDQFLMQPGLKWSSIPPSTGIQELVLSRCPVTSQQLLEWPVASRRVDWLDLSFSRVDDQLFEEPLRSKSGHGWDVRRLNVESTSVTEASLPMIASMPRLEELDVSRCDITDRGLEVLRGHKSIKTLWLTGNPKITDQGLAILASLPRLELTDLSETSVTEGGWKNLLSKSPRLRRKKP